MVQINIHTNTKKNPSIWSVHFAFWIVIFSLSVYFAALSINGMYLLQRSLVLIAVNIFLFYTIYSWIIPEFFLKKRILKAIVLLFVLIVLVAITRFYGDAYLMDKFNREPGFNISMSRRILLMLFGEFVFCGFAGLLRMTVIVYENNKRMDELEKLQLNTELLFLKAQMSPHFLFNSINNIYSLVLLKSDKAPEALMKLSELLRYSLYECHNKVTLQQELEAVKSYIDLFKLKFEDQIDLELKVELEHIDYPIEPLLYVPLIENALKYSGIGMQPNAYIRINFYELDNYIVLKINNSIGLQNKIQEASGIGLTNIKKRLENIYPEKYKLIINDSDGEFEITLKLLLL
ncbi:MAG: histidine kinase [Paludibacter sp.]